MKILSLIAGMLIIFASTISPTSLNGRFVVLNADNSKLAVQLQINTNTGIDDLGGATLVLGFDKTVLTFSGNPVYPTDYIFQNFNGGNYGTAKVTKPKLDQLWINIDLPYNNSNKGTILSGSTNWTNVVTLYFDIISPSDTIKLNWLTGNPFWGVYDGDNKTLFTSGTLIDLVKIQDPIQVNIPLDITSLTVTNTKSVTVKFSKKLDPNAAKNKNNYSISNNVLINQVQLLPDSSSVLLKTSQQQSNLDYTLTISEVKDQSGNLISPNPKTINYKIPSRGSGGGKVKNTISQAITASWEQSYSPDKMIDGVGMSTQTSRWQSAQTMPDTVTYDLGENVSLDSLRISFYQGESGRLYKYSIYSSKDLTTWNQVVDNVWSDTSEWTELMFDSTKGRYIKLVLKDSNRGNKASIWEFESYGTDKNKSALESGSPKEFSLMQNYPNPFNPSTKIKYSIPTSPLLTGQAGFNPTPYQGEGQGVRFVTLKVYDILGNEVSTLVEEQKAPGSYEVEFKAENLSSGVYIYRIQTADYTDTKKMILLR